MSDVHILMKIVDIAMIILITLVRSLTSLDIDISDMNDELRDFGTENSSLLSTSSHYHRQHPHTYIHSRPYPLHYSW